MDTEVPGSSAPWKVLVSLAGVAVACWVFRKVAKTRLDNATPPGASLDHRYRGYSPVDYDAACDSLKLFAREYMASFQFERCTKGMVESLHTVRSAVLKAMYSLRMSLPNDLDEERALAQHTEDIDRLLRQYVEDAQRRAGCELLFPDPIDDWFYRQHFRAANDVVR